MSTTDSIETDDGHRLTPWRRFGNPAFKPRDPHLRLLGWDPSGATLYLHPTLDVGDPRVERWDVRTGERLAPTFLPPDAPVSGLPIDAACSLINARRGGDEPEVTEVWDLRAGVRLATLPNLTWYVPFAAPADGRFVIRFAVGFEVFALPGGEPLGSWSDEPPCAVAPDGSLVVSRVRTRDHRAPGPLRVTRPDGTVVRALTSGEGRVYAADFSLDGRRVIVGLGDGEVACWEVATGERLWSTRPHDADGAPDVIVALARSADGETFYALDVRDRLCALSAAGAVRWCVALGPGLGRFWGHFDLRTSPDGASLAVLLRGESIRIVDAATGADRTPVEGHRGPLYALAVSADGRLAASSDGDGEVRVYDLTAGEVRWTLEVEGGAVGAVEFTPDGRSLWTAGADGTVRRWNLAAGSEESQRSVSSAKQWTGVVAAADGARTLAFTTQVLQLWSDRSAEPVLWSQPIESVVELAVAFCDAESQVALAISDPGLEGWSLVPLDATTGRRVGELEAMPGRLLGLRSTDDGPLSVAVEGERIVVREAHGARREVAVCEASDAVREVDVSADGRWMALADRDEVEVWSLAPTARRVARVRPAGELDSVAKVALSHDGGVLVIGTACGVVAAYARTESAVAPTV